MKEKPRRKALISVAAVLVVLGLLAAVWRWTSLSEWLDFRVLARSLNALRANPLGPYLVIFAFLIGSQVMFPITVLILATAYAFGPWLGFVYAMVGSLLGGVVTYALGYFMGHETFRHLAGRHYESLAQAFKENGLMAVITTHLLPVGPFTIVNLGAGAVRVRLRDFVVGSALGMLPGMALITIFAHQLQRTLRQPGWQTAIALATFTAALIAWALWTRRQARRKSPPS
ncbi:MAG TPA: VTT domain-containing protein [Candidatus Acidoferrales bacterium]|nr:VTT domain-containing protein [Candidatus Acidoferrales bacterium]